MRKVFDEGDSGTRKVGRIPISGNVKKRCSRQKEWRLCAEVVKHRACLGNPRCLCRIRDTHQVLFVGLTLNAQSLGVLSGLHSEDDSMGMTVHLKRGELAWG